MSVVTIDLAKKPDGCTATPQSGGALLPNTTYYYRVAAVTDVGETCASATFSATTTDVNKTIALSWNTVPSVKATGGYKVYRNTSDLWTSGSLLLATRDVNNYTDANNPQPGPGLPITFASSQIITIPEAIPSLLAEMIVPGKEDGDVQYLGSPPKRLRIEGFFKGSGAKADLDKLRSVRAGGVAVRVTITAHTQTWVQAYYLMAHLSWWLEPGTQNVSGAEVVRFTSDLMSL